MHDADCVSFLQWAVPELGLRWPGFRKVRGRLRRRLARRLRELGLADLPAYRSWLGEHPEEWARLDALCRITISRFFRDRQVFACLGSHVLPALARNLAGSGRESLRCWSAGCACGEEVYSVNLLWELEVRPQHPGIALAWTATDADPRVLERTRAGIYPEASRDGVPEAWRALAFEQASSELRVRDRFRLPMELLQQDLRKQMPEGPFDLVLCRNLALTYFAESLHREVLAGIAARMAPGAALVIGIHESLPRGAPGFEAWEPCRAVLRRSAG